MASDQGESGVSHLTLCFKQSPNPEVCSELAQLFVKQILYIRQQIPCPCDELLRRPKQEPKEGDRRRPRKSDEVKRDRVKEALVKLLDALSDPDLFACSAEEPGHEGCSARVLLVFGATPSSPTEAFRLSFPTLPKVYRPDPQDSSSVPAAEELSAQQANRLLARKLLAQGAPLFAQMRAPSRRAKLFLLLQRPECSGAGPQGWQAKPGFTLRLKPLKKPRKKRRLLSLRQAGQNESEKDSSGSSEEPPPPEEEEEKGPSEEELRLRQQPVLFLGCVSKAEEPARPPKRRRLAPEVWFLSPHSVPRL